MKSTFEIQKQLFLEAFTIIKDESKWIRAASAHNEHDQIVQPDAPSACKWCSLGIISKVNSDYIVTYGYTSHGFPLTQFRQFVLEIHECSIMNYNDLLAKSHEDIVTLWEEFGKSQNYF